MCACLLRLRVIVLHYSRTSSGMYSTLAFFVHAFVPTGRTSNAALVLVRRYPVKYFFFFPHVHHPASFIPLTLPSPIGFTVGNYLLPLGGVSLVDCGNAGQG